MWKNQFSIYKSRKKKRGTTKMIQNRNANIITDADGKKLVLINDIRFKDKRQIDWNDVKQYLEGYVGDYYEIEKNAELIYIGNELPEEYTESDSRKSLISCLSPILIFFKIPPLAFLMQWGCEK